MAIIDANGNPMTVDQLRELTDTDKRIADLEAQVLSQRTEIETLQGRYNDALRWLEIIGEELIEAANDNNLCEQYDEFIKDTNLRSPDQMRLQLPDRIKDWDIEVTVTSTLHACTTVTVQAASFDKAVDLLHENPDDYMDSSYAADVLYETMRDGYWFDYNVEIN